VVLKINGRTTDSTATQPTTTERNGAAAASRLNSMALFYASIPLMLFAVAIAVMPLIWAIAHEARRNELEALTPATVRPESQMERNKAA
jgi:hypothetical protein